ncbi:pseudouridine synthase [Xylariales sp. AK1849]|nr:pseudouridine synthase [Xylariales sp. AK1849]
MAASSPVLDGVFAVNKPVGMSSAQVIRDCQHHFNPSTFFKPMIDADRASKDQESNTRRKKRRFGKNDIRVKMGHGGTLDPLATGVLILGLGKGTKSLQQFLDCTKTYETIVLFGASTDTYDRVGKVLKKTAYDHITKPMVEEALKSFRGTLQQMPPLYSALKMEGKPLYEYAREGKPIPREIATREVNVTELEMVEWYEPGTHNHRWPAEDATMFERNFAEQVWKIEKDQTTKEKRTPEEEEEESKALEKHEQFKRKADETVDALVYDKFNKRRKTTDKPAMMSGALGDPPPPRKGKGSNLIPPSPDPNTPPPWDDKGPPAARIRMTVTSGFYVRSFCHDLGVKVGSAAMMAELCRSRQGDFVLGTTNCLEFAEVAKGEAVWAPQVEAALDQWNGKSHSTTAQPAKRAEQIRPLDEAQKSVESPPYKRKASEEFAVGGTSPKKTNSRPSSRDKKSASPKASSPSKEGRSTETKEKSEANGVAPTSNNTGVADEEWNGIEDNHEAPKL